ncbi:MAG: 16S rRNA (uracil(1498)-N(3))-methyltransferase [Clostridia bacterium]|nr:16S rRNA (uracil(1498)-N(3))-methyltransferase [Clostridia bacterium]
MQKFFVENNQICDSKVSITGSDMNHIVNVLRKKKNDTVLIGNKEDSKTYIAQIEQINADEVILNITDELDETSEPNVEIDLYQGLPKFDKMELIIQKTTELGISSIIPLDMSRCIVKLDEKDSKKKIERWQKIAEVAAKQSKRGKIPEIKDKMKLKEISNIIKEYDVFIVAYEEENQQTLRQTLREIEKRENYKIGILVGPEGGISNEEVEILKSFGCKSVSLGKRILRTETAPIAMTSNILYELEK